MYLLKPVPRKASWVYGGVVSPIWKSQQRRRTNISIAMVETRMVGMGMCTWIWMGRIRMWRTGAVRWDMMRMRTIGIRTLAPLPVIQTEIIGHHIIL